MWSVWACFKLTRCSFSHLQSCDAQRPQVTLKARDKRRTERKLTQSFPEALSLRPFFTQTGQLKLQFNVPSFFLSYKTIRGGGLSSYLNTTTQRVNLYDPQLGQPLQELGRWEGNDLSEAKKLSACTDDAFMWVNTAVYTVGLFTQSLTCTDAMATLLSTAFVYYIAEIIAS